MEPFCIEKGLGFFMNIVRILIDTLLQKHIKIQMKTKAV